jgi:hypothetical protein
MRHPLSWMVERMAKDHPAGEASFRLAQMAALAQPDVAALCAEVKRRRLPPLVAG